MEHSISQLNQKKAAKERQACGKAVHKKFARAASERRMAPCGLASLVTRNGELVCWLKGARFSPFFRLLSFELPPRRLLSMSKSIGRFGRIKIMIK